jgi:predicted alpha-1,2-mannosidase
MEGRPLSTDWGLDVITANAVQNLESEQQGFRFDEVRAAASERWERKLSRVRVTGGTDDQRVVFYTALYHALIHPNLLNDVNGEYPAMESDKVLTANGNRYTVFSLWDTYRNVHQLLTLLYPGKQLEMVRSMVGMYRESGWLPKWELYGRETRT